LTEVAINSEKDALPEFKVIQGHRICRQLKGTYGFGATATYWSTT